MLVQSLFEACLTVDTRKRQDEFLAVMADLAFSWLDQMTEEISALFISVANKSDAWKRIVLPYQVKRR